VDSVWALFKTSRADSQVNVRYSPVSRLTPGVFNFVLALGMGQTVCVASDAALASEPEFDLAGAMGALLSAGVFTGIHPDNTEPDH